jgi:hypothetical protein
MKITVVKKATNAKPQGYCSCFVDDLMAKAKK